MSETASRSVLHRNATGQLRTYNGYLVNKNGNPITSAAPLITKGPIATKVASSVTTGIATPAKKWATVVTKK